ncbi:MAG: flagellar basal body L-ring protein FlgH [Alphaproteobacteria bacterium]|nr:flagellar basal body L-ring protein FlgH [Alphaproteobacteria bacterium]
MNSEFKALKNITFITLLSLMTISTSGCSYFSRLKEIGKEPEHSKIENPTKAKDYKPVDMPMPDPQPAFQNTNSLWRPGSRGFFKDQRASQVGDILTVHVVVADKALLENKTERTRGNDKSSTSVNNLMGLEKYTNKVLPSAAAATSLLNLNSSSETTGDGSIDRNEKIDVTMAAIVTQVLPNGNLVIQGKQEVRVNYEMRQLNMTGIIRREDISVLNTIKSEKIAELRVSYGGKGTISDLQQPKIGQQIVDIINPF